MQGYSIWKSIVGRAHELDFNQFGCLCLCCCLKAKLNDVWQSLGGKVHKIFSKILQPSPKKKRREAHSTARSLRKMSKTGILFVNSMRAYSEQVACEDKSPPKMSSWNLMPITKEEEKNIFYIISTLHFVGFICLSFFWVDVISMFLGMPNPSQYL